MRKAWRLCKARHAQTALDGEGARLVGGRWNRKGTRLVYAAESISLAALELLVHATPGQLLAADLVVVELELPDALGITEISVDELPTDWRTYPAPPELQDIGEDWIQTGKTPLLRVPSSVIPREFNLLLNPAHSDTSRVRIASVLPFDADPRLQR